MRNSEAKGERAFWDSKAAIEAQGCSYEGMHYHINKVLRLFGNIEGKRILDCGCGNGITTVLLGKSSAVYAFDISDEQIEQAKIMAKRMGVAENIRFQQADLYALNYEDEMFDLVFGAFILHHLTDMDRAGRSISRVMVTGAKAIFLENWGGNPLLNRLRPCVLKLIPSLRYFASPDEKALTLEDITALCRHFSQCRVIFPYFYFWQLGHYFTHVKVLHTLIGNRFVLPVFLKSIRWMDAIIYHCFPFLRRFSYHVVIEAVK